MTVNKKTPLFESQCALKARIMAFTGWELPVWYTSILDEHRAVRSHAGIFDVSHMGRLWISGKMAGTFLDRVLSRSVQDIKMGGGKLCLLCFEDGGILDDLWVYRIEADQYLVVWNAGHITQKMDWLLRQADSNPDVIIRDSSSDTVMLAVQGPAVSPLESLQNVSNIPRFSITQAKIGTASVLAARTGYTGEDGFEIITDNANASYLWDIFLKEGVKPCGLGARDILRLEAGLLLCGQDMDTHTNPFEAGLGWLVELGRDDFVGKKALVEIKRRGISRKLVGFKMMGKEIPRSHYKIFISGREAGEVTSGGYSPSLDAGIGLGYVPVELSGMGTDIDIIIRNKHTPARITSKLFYKRGELNESSKL